MPRRSKQYPEPGKWVAEDIPGMPKTPLPAPLEKSARLSVDEVREAVLYDGLGFCLWHLIPPEKIQDRTLRVLWKRAREALEDITSHLDEFDLGWRSPTPQKKTSKKKRSVARGKKEKEA